LGYRHGCQTAKGKYSKNQYKYRNSNSYRKGWLAGKRDCKRYKKKRYNSNYDLGYKHGCSSATNRYTRNSYKFRNSKSYKRGWRRGREDCSY